MINTLATKDNFEAFTIAVEKYTHCIVDKIENLTGQERETAEDENYKNFYDLWSRNDYEFYGLQDGTWPEGGNETWWSLRFPNDESNELRIKNAVELIAKSLSDLENYLKNRYNIVELDVFQDRAEIDEYSHACFVIVRVSFRDKVKH